MKQHIIIAGLVFLAIGIGSFGGILSLQTVPSSNTQNILTSSEVPPKTSFTTAKLGTTESNLPYCTVNGSNLVMDMYWPNEGTGPFPLVVYVHGGGWSSGDKTENLQQYVKQLTPKGIAVAAVNYRLAKDSAFPAMIEDVKCAIRHLRANAKTYAIDPDRIGAFGGSAGGHLVSLLGTADASAGWDKGAYQDTSSSVAAVVEFFGPTDLREPFNGNDEEILQNVFKQTAYEDMGFASPITYITPNDPPFLIFHGEEDSLVPISQSETFSEALRAAGIDVTFVRVANAGHSFRPINESKPTSPTVPEIAAQMSAWFAEKLK